MGQDAHLSASASQIYPPPPQSKKSHSKSSSAHSSFHLNPISPTSDELHEPDAASSRRIRILDVARLGLTVLSIAIAATVVGCHAHTLNVYNITRLDDGFWLPPMWPREFDLRPTQGMVVGGAVAALVGLVYVLVGVVPVVSFVLFLFSEKSSDSG